MDRTTENLLTREEAAAEAGVCVTTIGRWVKRGFLAAIPTPGRSVRFRRGDVLAIESRHQKRHHWNEDAQMAC